MRHRDGRVVDRIDLEGVPTAVAMHPDGHTLMVATSPGTAETQERSTLHFLPLDAARKAAEAELCDGPARAMVPFRDLDRLYVACEDGELAELDLRLRTQIRTVRFNGKSTLEDGGPHISKRISYACALHSRAPIATPSRMPTCT